MMHEAIWRLEHAYVLVIKTRTGGGLVDGPPVDGLGDQ